MDVFDGDESTPYRLLLVFSRAESFDRSSSTLINGLPYWIFCKEQLLADDTAFYFITKSEECSVRL